MRLRGLILQATDDLTERSINKIMALVIYPTRNKKRTSLGKDDDF